MDGKVLDRFVGDTPFAVMAQIVIRRLIGKELDAIFEESRSRQYHRQLAFSDLASTVALVALGCVKSFNKAYQRCREQIGVSRTAFYDKINRTEPSTLEAVVEHAGEVTAGIQDELQVQPWEIIPGHEVYAFDACHIKRTQKRLSVLRGLSTAPRPGAVVAKFDLQHQTFSQAYLLVDAHRQEATMLDRIAHDLTPGDVALADRQYCAASFFMRLDSEGKFFIVRQHRRMQCISRDERQFVGRIESGEVFEQKVEISKNGQTLWMRRLTLCLDQPTRDGDTEIHVLTNLSANVKATRIMEVYGFRWEEETGFYHLTMSLTCEMETMGHPHAALFLFCMAMVCYNVLAVLTSSLYAVHDEQDVENLSYFSVAEEIGTTTRGLLIAVDEAYWRQWEICTPSSLSKELIRLADRVPVSRYRKSQRGVKKKPPKRTLSRTRAHSSTARLLGIVKTP
ncbi:transposase [Roseiconus lacunae]|uniref:transposase n=1 Tax=Roseiconus lacunae TaxID=2605694 RepID=UPI00309210F0|nr:transposase [Stieleria sp. HD01]